MAGEQQIIGQIKVGDQAFDLLRPREEGLRDGDLIGIIRPDGQDMYGFVVKNGQFGEGKSYFNPLYPPGVELENGDLDLLSGEKVYLRRSEPGDQASV